MRKNIKKILILVFILGIIIVGIVAFFKLNSKPEKLTQKQKEEAVAQILGRKPNLNPDIKTGDTSYDSKLITFSYPARAVVYGFKSPEDASNTSNIDNFSFDIENPRLILNYTAVKNSSATDLDDIPAIKFRNDASRGYEKENIDIDGINAVVYKKDGGGSARAEYSAFILKDGVFYTFSITGASLEDVDVLFEQIVSSAAFK